MAQQITVPGAVGVAVKCKDGVVLGNDRRATWGYTVTNKSTRKVFKITDHIGLTAYGLIGDYQMLTKILRAQANLYKMDANERISTKSLGKLVSNYLYSRKMAPLYTNLVVAGMDKDGPKLYTLDAIGSLIPEDYGAAGTGMLLSMGILEAEYEPDISVAEGEKLVEKVIRNSIKRDAMSGNGIDILTITKDGATEKYLEIEELGE
ncbi:MAG: proteasome subunit beta [Candidatus Lokiarchaeota archaeon]|nr:proteasome subunit beta [Candidatus Lokiarchaeota archaeon]MBD3202555.1 proteasome subunit beta [Candidatus Lokiarchaeota archaeon]